MEEEERGAINSGAPAPEDASAFDADVSTADDSASADAERATGARVGLRKAVKDHDSETSSVDASIDAGAGPLFMSQQQRAAVQGVCASAESSGDEGGGTVSSVGGPLFFTQQQRAAAHKCSHNEESQETIEESPLSFPEYTGKSSSHQDDAAEATRSATLQEDLATPLESNSSLEIPAFEPGAMGARGAVEADANAAAHGAQANVATATPSSQTGVIGAAEPTQPRGIAGCGHTHAGVVNVVDRPQENATAGGEAGADVAGVSRAVHAAVQPVAQAEQSHVSTASAEEQTELLVRFHLPPANQLAPLLEIPPDAAAAVVPRLRWLGREVGSLSSSGGSWQLSVILSGKTSAVFERMTTADFEQPFLSLHIPGTHSAAPLALASLPISMLRQTDAGAELDEMLELYASNDLESGSNDGSLSEPAVRLGVKMWLRPRDAAIAACRERDPHVTFTVRLRMQSLTLFRAPEHHASTPPVSYTVEDYEESNGSIWYALRLCEYAGCLKQQSTGVRCVAGHPSDLGSEELSISLPNPPFTPQAALQRLLEQPLVLELIYGQSPVELQSSPKVHALASLCLEDVCGGSLVPLPRGPNTPNDESAAATSPVSRIVELIDPSSELEVKGHMSLAMTLQCVYKMSQLDTSAVPSLHLAGQRQRLSPALAARGAQASDMTAKDKLAEFDCTKPLSYRFSISVRSVRDLNLPLGGYSNVYCRFLYRMLETAGGGSNLSRAVRSSPPVLLPKHGEVSLPNGGCVFEFACEPVSLLQTLAHEPLLVELWHKDRYAADLLLGIATVDLAEIVGVGPRPSGRSPSGFVTTERTEELVVPVRAPIKTPAPLRRAADTNATGNSTSNSRRGKGNTERVALMRVNLRLEELGPRVPPPDLTLGGARQVPALPASQAPGERGASHEEVALLRWRQREESRWRAALKKREDELIAELSREWTIREKQREQEITQQRRMLGMVETELKAKLVEVAEQQKALRTAENELASRAAAIEQKAALDVVNVQTAALREQTRMQGEVSTAQAALGQAQAKVAMLEERLIAAEAREQRHEEQAIRMSDSTAESSARALTLQAEVARLSAMLRELRDKHEAALSAAEQRKQQALTAHRELHRLQEEVRIKEEQRLREQLASERHAHEQMQLRAQADFEQQALAAEASELHHLKLQLAQLEAAQPRDGPTHSRLAQGAVSHAGAGALQRGGYGSKSCGTVNTNAASCTGDSRVGEVRGRSERDVESSSPSAATEQNPARAEVERLQSMCDDFVRSGMYSQGDRVLLLLQQRIGELTAGQDGG